jgi:hypothetical protein
MSRIVIAILIYHHHKPIDFICLFELSGLASQYFIIRDCTINFKQSVVFAQFFICFKMLTK